MFSARDKGNPTAYYGVLFIKGTVQVEAIVGRDGTVKKVKLIGGHPLLAEAALQAVMKWKYEPAQQETTELVKLSFGDANPN